MQKQQPIIHFCHIPKCGGKSLRRGLREAYGDRICLFNPTPLRVTFLEKILYKCLQAKNFIKPYKYINNFDIVYGHYNFDFLYSSYQRPIKRAAFFRDPVEWVGSFYFYHKKKFQKEFNKIDILQFIKKYNLEKGYRIHLGSFSVGKLDFVGITEQYQESLKLYKKRFGVSIEHYHMNKTNVVQKSYKEYFIEQGIYEKVTYLMKENIEIYEQAIDLFKRMQNETY
mgnify:FL=1